MGERDYEGPIEYFEKQLKEAGISKDEFDISDYVGCTRSELQALVERAKIFHERKENSIG